MQRFQSVPPVGVLFDCDLGNDIEDVLAMALLYGLDGKQECRVVATTVSKPNLKAAALSEVIGRFYAGQVSGAFNARGRTLPVGLATDGPGAEDTPLLTVPLAKQLPDGTPAWRHGIESVIDTAEPVNVLRNALTAQHPQNAAVVVAGPLSNLAALLRHPAAGPFIVERARLLVIAAGGYPEGKPDRAIAADIAAARKVFAEWPTPIVAVGAEIGEAVLFPGASIAKDFAWTEAHPVVDAYRAHFESPQDVATSAMAAVLYAVRGAESLLDSSEPGKISVTENGGTRFVPSADGTHRYVKVDAASVVKLQETYVQLASAKPVPRAPRRRPVEAPKPEPAKAKPPSGAGQSQGN